MNTRRRTVDMRRMQGGPCQRASGGALVPRSRDDPPAGPRRMEQTRL